MIVQYVALIVQTAIRISPVIFRDVAQAEPYLRLSRKLFFLCAVEEYLDGQARCTTLGELPF